MFDAGQGGASRGVLTICIGLRFPQQEKAPETMTKDFPAITKRISDDIKKLRKDIPDTLNGFSALANAALRGGALDKKTKELVALALGVAAHCDGCIGFHAETLVKLGASRQEIEEALGMAVYMGGGPALMYAADASRHLSNSMSWLTPRRLRIEAGLFRGRSAVLRLLSSGDGREVCARCHTEKDGYFDRGPQNETSWSLYDHSACGLRRRRRHLYYLVGPARRRARGIFPQPSD